MQARSIVTLLELSQLRYLWRHRLQTLLAILGIALGVAVVNAVDIVNYSAQQNLRQSVQQVDQLANFRIVAAEQYFDEDFYAQLRHEILSRHPTTQISPVLEGTLTHKFLENKSWQLLGVDPLNATGLLSSHSQQHNIDFATLLSDDNSVLIALQAAQQNSAFKNNTLMLELEDGNKTLNIAGRISHDNPQLLIADIDTAQKLLNVPGKLSYINITINPEKTELIETIEKNLPSQLKLVPTEQLIEGQLSLIKALEFNLSALSLLALVVGGFLIFSTVRFSILQRAPLFSRLRVQGVGRRQLQGLLIKEALLLAIIGISCGWVLGAALSQLLAPISSRTIEDLYATTTNSDISTHWSLYIKTALLGLLTTVLTSMICYKNLQRQTLSHTLGRIQQEVNSRKNRYRLFVFGLVLAAITAGALPNVTSLISSYAIVLAAVASALFLLPLIVHALYPLTHYFFSKVMGTVGLIAIRDCQRETSRVLLAITALCIAVAASNGIATMVDSFRGSVSQWIETQLGADIYIRPLNTTSKNAAITPDIIQQLTQIDAIDHIYSSQFKRVFIDNKWLPLNVIETASLKQENAIDLITTDNDQLALQKFKQGHLFISEPLARKKQLQLNSQLSLLTPKGTVSFTIAGIFRDYGAEHGRIVMAYQQYKMYWPEARVDSIAIYLKDPQQKQQLLETLKQSLLKHYPLRVIDSAVVRQYVLKVFDRTFAITQVLQVLVLFISVIAIISTLMLYQLQRREQLLTLRALGLTVKELRKLFFIQAGFIGGIAGLLAIPLGLLIAWLLVNIINPAAFGWSLQFHINPTIYLSGTIIALLAGLLAAIYPALHFGKAANITELSRE